MRTLLPLLLTLAATWAFAQPRTLLEWSFDTDGDLEGWKAANHITGLRVEGGALKGTIADWDPFVTGPRFEIPATPWQRIEARIKTDADGGGEFFWTNTTESQYGGFSPGKETPFRISGDGQWHTYQVYPFWHSEKKIILLRLDFPRPAEADYGKKTFEVDYIRIVDLGSPDEVATEADWKFGASTLNWEPAEGATVVATPEGLRFSSGDNAGSYMLSPALRYTLDDRLWVHIDMKVDKGTAGYIRWVSSDFGNIHLRKFPVNGDGKFHSYNVNMGENREWAGDILLLSLQPTNTAGATAVIRRIAVTEEPEGVPEVEVTYVGLEDAINRAGRPANLLINLMNRGGETARGLAIDSLSLPDGVQVASTGDWRQIEELAPFEPATHKVRVTATGAVDGMASVKLAGAGAPDEPATGQVAFTEPLNVAKADYVPEPRPVESDYEIGALYFPGFPTMDRWDPIRRVSPERKPVLGWYDEGNPECVDWQIKWAVEHGIKFFLVDWYWSSGGRHLEHWVKAFEKARYRSYLKWAMMWANHNAPGSHSEEDQRAVTQYWLDNCFNMPEYMRIDDKPVVMIWSVGGMDRDMEGKGGAARLLEISREMAIEAGYKGIYFIAMKWPEASTDPAIIKDLADKGFDMTSIYHYMHHGGKAEDPQHFPFELVADSSYDHWKSWHEADIIPFLPNLSTGWDSRPWHGDKSTVIYGRTPELFRRICEDAKRFADETGVTRMTLAPLNEWGEGSYAEPCKEFGFEMYDAVRDVFCKKPAEGWPLNLIPSDVGLGPYDLPEAVARKRDAWDFSDGSQGWGPFMGIGAFGVKDGALEFVTNSHDPAIGISLKGIRASDWTHVLVRMKIDSLQKPDEQAQLFWSTTTTGVSEANSAKVKLIGDGEYHDYLIPVGESSRWKTGITTFRFDPCGHTNARIAIDEIRLVKQ